ncbi:MAG: hypothetical protein GYA57_07525, partial [Myxococcales bacterium]|nr:hypothetical protein [Myxococcales bacterium]
ATALLGLGLAVSAAAVARAEATGGAPVRFLQVAIYIDSGPRPLAAWQIEFLVRAGDVEVVGVEGGEHPAYAEPAYYDPAALREYRLVLAAFDTGTDLPAGRTRVATLHLMVRGAAAPELDARLVVAADPDGRSFDAAVTIEEGGVR